MTIPYIFKTLWFPLVTKAVHLTILLWSIGLHYQVSTTLIVFTINDVISDLFTHDTTVSPRKPPLTVSDLPLFHYGTCCRRHCSHRASVASIPREVFFGRTVIVYLRHRGSHSVVALERYVPECVCISGHRRAQLWRTLGRLRDRCRHWLLIATPERSQFPGDQGERKIN